MSQEWRLADMIKKGMIPYAIGDKVVVFRRKSNGYPKSIKDNIEYTIKRVENQSIEVALNSSDGVGWLQSIKVHKTYMLPKYILRDINLKKLLDDSIWT